MTTSPTLTSSPDKLDKFDKFDRNPTPADCTKPSPAPVKLNNSNSSTNSPSPKPSMLNSSGGKSPAANHPYLNSLSNNMSSLSSKSNPNGSAGHLISSNSVNSNSSSSNPVSLPSAKDADQRFSINNLTNNNSAPIVARKAKREKSDNNLDPQPTDLKGKPRFAICFSKKQHFRCFLAPRFALPRRQYRPLATFAAETAGVIPGNDSGESMILLRSGLDFRENSDFRVSLNGFELEPFFNSLRLEVTTNFNCFLVYYPRP